MSSICNPMHLVKGPVELYGVELFWGFLQLAVIFGAKEGEHIELLVGVGPVQVKAGVSVYGWRRQSEPRTW
jgi:hypothetical protein